MNIKRLTNTKCPGKGFTLVEMLVSIGLFSLVMTFSLAVIFSIFDVNKKFESLNSVVDNLNFAIDSMVRDMKTGTDYSCHLTSPLVAPISSSDVSCDPSQPTPNSTVGLRSTIYGPSRSVLYSWVPPSGSNPGTLFKQTCTPASGGTPENCNTKPVALTSPEINITKFGLYVSDPAPSAGQPGIFIVIGGTAQINATQVSNFNIQTFASERTLNI